MISRELETCHSQLEPLDAVVNKAKSTSTTKQAATTKAWMSFKFALKKRGVAEFEAQLQGAMMNLNAIPSLTSLEIQ